MRIGFGNWLIQKISAYLTKDPSKLGSLIGQDLAKITLILLITVGTLLQTLIAVWGPHSHLLKALLAGLVGGEVS